MPIVASMGGVAGNQTLILVIRGIAMGKSYGDQLMKDSQMMMRLWLH